jgi:hypothetical protein
MAAIEPTLDDSGVMDFVASGFVLLEGIVDDAFNRSCSTLAGGNADAFIGSEEFTRAVLLHPEVAGVARSLLGENFLVPAGGHHHLFEKPFLGQTWHSDGLSGSGYDVTELQCYYYPHDVEIEDGPTMVLPGSHCRAVDREAIAHYGDIVGQVSLIVPAGTVVMASDTRPGRRPTTVAAACSSSRITAKLSPGATGATRLARFPPTKTGHA